MYASDSDSDDDLLSLLPSGLSQSSSTYSPVIKIEEKEKLEEKIIKEDEEELNKRAKNVIDSVSVPDSINDTKQLHWYKSAKKKTIFFYPCRECPKDMLIGLNLKQDFNEDKKTPIEYLSFVDGGKYDIAPNSRLVPAGDESWNADKMKKYLGNLQAKKTLLELRKEEFYLKKIFHVASERKAKINEEASRKKISKCNGNQSQSDDFVEDFFQKIKPVVSPSAITPSKKRKKQSLKVGDWIEFTKAIFVAGDERGKTRALIVEVTSGGDKRLVLHPFDEILPVTHMVKRIATRKSKRADGKVRYEIIGTPTFQQIREHRLIKGKLPAHDSVLRSISSTTDNISETIEKHMALFTEKVKQDGLENFLDSVKPVQGKVERKHRDISNDVKADHSFSDYAREKQKRAITYSSTKRKNSPSKITKDTKRRKSLRLSKLSSPS